MIKINLALRKQAAALESKDKTQGIGIASLKEINMGAVKELFADPQFRKAVLALVVIFMGWYLLDGYKTDQLAKLDVELQKVTAENQKVRQALAKTSGYEAQKKQFDADEQLIKTKFETIQKLVADRSDPPKLLLSFSNSIPKDVWLQEFDMTSKDVRVKGSSLGFDPVTDFMKALGDNDLMTDVKLDESQKSKDPLVGEVATFSVEAKRK